MKKILIAVVMALIATMADSASAADVSPAPVVNATATVDGVCQWFQDGDISFVIDPSAGGPIGATVTRQPKVKCTNQKGFTVAAVSANKGGVAASCAAPGGITGLLRSEAAGTDTFEYTFTCGTAAGTGAGFGAGKEQDLGVGGVAGSVAASQYQDAVAHADYKDTLTLTVTY